MRVFRFGLLETKCCTFFNNLEEVSKFLLIAPPTGGAMGNDCMYQQTQQRSTSYFYNRSFV
jgi:hypothetical protein